MFGLHNRYLAWNDGMLSEESRRHKRTHGADHPNESYKSTESERQGIASATGRRNTGAEFKAVTLASAGSGPKILTSPSMNAEEDIQRQIQGTLSKRQRWLIYISMFLDYNNAVGGTHQVAKGT